MLPNLVLLALFCAVLCSASKLEHFKDILNREDSHQFYYGVMEVERYDQGGDLSEVVDDCSELCYKSKYFCDMFMVLSCETPLRHICYMYNSRATELTPRHLPNTFTTKAVFKLSERNDIEPLEKRFSYDHTITIDEWVANLQTGYFPTVYSIPKDVPTVALKAMNSKPAKAIDFDKWASSKDVSQSQRKSLELQELTGRKIMEAIKAWRQVTNGNKEVSTRDFDTLLLTFLDIFCPLLQQGIKSFYDPIKKVVFITKKTMHILVASYGPGDIAIVRSHHNLQLPEGEPYVFVTTFSRTSTNPQGNPVELFEKVVKMFTQFPNAHYDTTNYTYDVNEPLNTIVEILRIVVSSLSWDVLSFPQCERPLGPSFTFYRDLITVILSTVYKNYGKSLLSTNLERKLTGRVYDDISIFTSQGSEKL